MLIQKVHEFSDQRVEVRRWYLLNPPIIPPIAARDEDALIIDCRKRRSKCRYKGSVDALVVSAPDS
jgi:hypothetical protein